MQRYILFAIRWLSCSAGLYISVELFGHNSLHDLLGNIGIFLIAGLIFSIINAVVKPVVTVMSLPFMLATMGLFTIVINGFMVWLTIVLLPPIKMSFLWAMVSSLIVSLLNYLINSLTPNKLIKEGTNETNWYSRHNYRN